MDESQNIEYKQSWRDEYLKWICGFANAQGGRIYVGIDDNKNVVGIANSKQLMEDIPNKIATTLGLVVDVNLLQSDDKDYIEIVVPPSSQPISYHGVFHYRSGSTKQELTGIALQQFLLRRMGTRWENLTVDYASIEDIDREAIDYFLHRSIAAQRAPSTALTDSTERILRNLHLLSEKGKLTNAALLVFGKDPARFFVGCDFRIGRFGRNEADLIFQDVIGGNILQMVDKVIWTLKSKYLISPIHYEGLQRVEPLEIPESALRECICNAIVHKDYMGAHIQMKVYDGRVRLWNPGALPETMTVEDLMAEHESRPRNPLIANVFYMAGFIETWGRGISKICEGFKAEGMDAPTFDADLGGVTVTIRRKDFDKQVDTIQKTNQKNDDTNQKTNQKTIQKGESTNQKTNKKNGLMIEKGLTEQQHSIINYIKEHPTATRHEIAKNIPNAAPGGIKYNISRLQLLGILRRVGGRKQGYWELLQELQD